MKRILQAISIAVAVCAVQRLVAIDYVISGNQTVYNVDGLKTSAVMTVSFTLTRAGTNWAISNTYTNTGVKDTIALAGGCTYSVTTDPSGASAGLVMDDPIDRLDVATVFPRVLVLAFLTPQQRLEDVTNAPVPFLWPHHAALHCYRWSFKWSNEAPWLPAQVRFELDRDLARRVHPDVISSYFRSGYRDRALFKQFQETQRTGAQYSVAAWTNWQGASLPLRAMISFTTFDHVTGGGTIRQLLTVAVTGITRPDSDSLIPALAPGDGVQHILNRTCYYYTSAGGQFLSPEQAKAVGRVLALPPPPRWVAAVQWLRSGLAASKQQSPSKTRASAPTTHAITLLP